MAQKDFIISGDGHLLEPTDLFRTRLPKRLRDRAVWEEDFEIEPFVEGGARIFRRLHTPGFEGWTISRYRQTGGRMPEGDPDIKVLELPPWAPLEVNALQRASTIVIQKSLREGFGLTVSEALWKKKPVVASAVGGIPNQIIHKHTGLLAHSVEGTAYQVRFLLSHPEIAARLGEHGYAHVKENFLITQNLKRYLTLFLASQPAG